MRLARWLMPTDSMVMPRALRRTTSATRATMAMAITNATGNPNTVPVEIHAKPSLRAEVFCPPVITLARPRPVIIMINVVMKGWRPTTDTSRPLMAPRSTVTSRDSPSAVSTAPVDPEWAADARNSIDTAPDTAISEPTDRSMPAVAITRVMPMAIMSTGALPRRMSIREP